LQKIIRTLSNHPEESIPKASQNSAVSQSIYRFWSNKKISPKQISESHRPSVLKRVNSQKVVLAIQDTTDLDFSGLKKTKGLGFINQSTQQGIKVHSCLAVSGEGEPLGILHQQTWTRTERSGKKDKRRQKATKDKESQRWLDTLQASEKGVDESVCILHMGDREADIYDLFVQPRQDNSELLIRAEHNRKVQHELQYLIPALEQAPIMAEKTIELERNPERAARQATLTVRVMTVTIEVPANHKQRSRYQPVTLNALLVEEPTPPSEGTPIRWLLLTTLSIDTAQQAWQCVYWYSLRWLIERFHFTLKSGCRIEHLQLETASRLLNALATFSIVACRLMGLTYQARLTPDAPCDSVLQPSEWRLLRRKFAPKNRSAKPPSLRQAIRWIAQLGGFLARSGDAEPGLKTLWRGMGVLHHLLEGSQLAPKT
jgi:hypothetical protein